MSCLDVNTTAAQGRQSPCGRCNLGGKQNRRIEQAKNSPKTAKLGPHRSCCAGFCGSPTRTSLARKADVPWEETGKCTMGATAEQGHSSGKGYAEITSGRTVHQQGLTATCKDFPHKASS